MYLVACSVYNLLSTTYIEITQEFDVLRLTIILTNKICVLNNPVVVDERGNCVVLLLK